MSQQCTRQMAPPPSPPPNTARTPTHAPTADCRTCKHKAILVLVQVAVYCHCCAAMQQEHGTSTHTRAKHSARPSGERIYHTYEAAQPLWYGRKYSKYNAHTRKDSRAKFSGHLFFYPLEKYLYITRTRTTRTQPSLCSGPTEQEETAVKYGQRVRHTHTHETSRNKSKR